MGSGYAPRQNRSLRFTPNPIPGHDPTSFFDALGSGTLTRLHTLKIGYSFAPPDVLGDANLVPNSLPSLRDLYIATPMSAGLLGRIFAAAGPALATINIDNGHTAAIAVRLLAENDYVWAPALKSLVLKPREADEMVVRLLAPAEGGGLQNLATLKLEFSAWGRPPRRALRCCCCCG